MPGTAVLAFGFAAIVGPRLERVRISKIVARWRRQPPRPLEAMRPVLSRKRAWRTTRRVRDLPQEVEPKTIRCSVATELRRMGTVPATIALARNSEKRRFSWEMVVRLQDSHLSS